MNNEYIKFLREVMMIMNCFCDTVEQPKTFSFLSSGDHCQGSSPLQISDMQGAEFELAQTLISSFDE